MPTYEYECKECGKVFELFQSIKAKTKRIIRTECTQCNNRAPVTRLIGAGAAILFKGSGFYETDYRSESYKKAAKADSAKDDSAKADNDGAGTKKDGDGKKSKETSGGKDAAVTKSDTPATKKSSDSSGSDG